MSRENKLALIIGFGLVLFVGVLISDHLSEANRLVTADLAMAIDPLVDEDENTPLVEFGPVEPRLAVLEERPIALPMHHQHVVEEGQTLPTITMGQPAAAPIAVPAANEPDPLEVYTVQPGDTLSQIAQKLLGSSRDTDRLFEMNRDVIGNIDALQVGMELRYPRSSS